MVNAARYWIQFTHQACPVCGKGHDYQDRIYDRPKPDDPSERHIFEEIYDYCMEYDSIGAHGYA